MRGIIIGIPISLLMWAAIIYGVMCATAKAADELEYLAMVNVDRAVCGLHVPQITVERYISGAAIKYSASQDDVIKEAVALSTVMRDHLQESGLLKEYCAKRAEK